MPLFLPGITRAVFYFDDEPQWAIHIIIFSESVDKSISELSNTKPTLNNRSHLNIRQALLEMNTHYPEMYKRNL